MVTNLRQLKPITDDVDFNNITIGNSDFSDDTWDLSPFVQNKSLKRTYKKINFSYIQSEDMKLTVKQYAYYKLGKIKPRTVKSKINSSLPSFINYC